MHSRQMSQFPQEFIVQSKPWSPEGADYCTKRTKQRKWYFHTEPQEASVPSQAWRNLHIQKKMEIWEILFSIKNIKQNVIKV